MKLETFFEKFDLFADAPDAVAKMRELVLQLAVQGKLVDQLPGDEPATMLLGRIEKTKQRLINERAIRRQDTEPISEDIAPFSIPKSWVWTRLGEIGDWGSGSTPARGNHELYGGGITWLKSGELNDNQALAGSSETVTDLALKTGSFRRNQPGDVLFAMYGATIGKVAILAESAVTNQAVCGCTPFEGISNRYLFNYLISQRTAFHAASEGGAQPNLSKVKIVAFPFPLPPLAEQKRIVAKVDELMALCDRLEAQQQERETRHAALARASLAHFADAPTPVNLNFLFHPSYTISPAELRKSILTLAVQGKLVHQDPNDEPVKELLARIDSCRNALLKAGIVPKQKPLADIGEGECQHSIPETWQWIRLQRASEIIDPNPSHRMPRYCDSGVPFISTENFVGREEIDFSIGKQVDEAQLEEQKKGFTIRPGSFALSRIGTIGKTRILPLERNYCMSHALVVIAPYSEDINPKYLRMVVSSDAVQGQASHGAKSIGVPDLGMGKIRSFVVPIPPLTEQRRIVAKVEQLIALVDALDAQIAASRVTAVKLLAAFVAELTGTPKGRSAPPSPITNVAASSRPKPQKAIVASAKSITEESAVSSSTLADLRKAAGLTQASIAEAMGLNQAYISQMETGKRPITKEQHKKLVEILGLSLN